MKGYKNLKLDRSMEHTSATSDSRSKTESVSHGFSVCHRGFITRTRIDVKLLIAFLSEGQRFKPRHTIRYDTSARI